MKQTTHPSRAGVLATLTALLAGLLVALGAGPAAAATDLALGRPASTDSTQAGHPAAAGADGNAGTRWCAADGRTGHWWQVDLGATTDLTGSRVVWEFARAYQYRVQASTDGTNWTVVADRSTGTATAQTRDDAFTARGRYVRITVTGLPQSTWASLSSFSVFGTQPPATGGPEPDPALLARCAGTAPITCHYDLAPGNYDVTLVLGDANRAGSTTVHAEARRNLLGPVSTAAGQLSRQTLTVNVRQPEGQPTGQGGTGTPGLDLVLGGSAPRLSGIGIAPAASGTRRLFLAGDSTVCDQPTTPYTGWGQQLPQYYRAGLAVANYADSGESSGSFLNVGSLFPTMAPLIRSGDHVLIQFGHNDKTTTEVAFRQNLTDLVSGVRARGGVPVLVTPPVRRLFTSDGSLSSTALHVNSVGVNLPAVTRQLASAQGVPLIDLTARSATLVRALGPTASQQLFLTQATDGVTDNTHFSSYGAQEMAKLVRQGIRDLGLPLLADERSGA
ncbi:discoidin domain-containing protein [Micromonospora sp. 067-2]|uniref:discoidin domain-containing protein n=1 Tax=Micromonospora sp. 067-2 TaxID=2789270 RepID=UPI00397C5D86